MLGSALALAGTSALGCAGRGHRPGAGHTYDVLVQGGTVHDGTGAPGVAADVGIAGGRIVAIGALAGAGARTRIDAHGLAVAPGFIDFHSHADGTLFDDPNAESVLRQGVTTVVAGQDGRGGTVLLADDRLSHRSEPDHARDVDGGREVLDGLEERAHASEAAIRAGRS